MNSPYQEGLLMLSSSINQPFSVVRMTYVGWSCGYLAFIIPFHYLEQVNHNHHHLV